MVLAAVLALPGSALAATTFCVPDDTIAGCPENSTPEADVPAAVAAAADGDTIRIGVGTFPKNPPAVSDAGKRLHFIGEGMGQTIIQGLGSPAMELSAAQSTVSNLTVNLHDEQGGLGLMLAGTATKVAVTATGTNNTTNPLGVQLLSGGTFSQGTITLPLTATEIDHYAGVIGSGTVSDSSITAPVAVGADVSSATPAVVRDSITANQGVLVGTSGGAVDDSLIRTAAGTQPELGIGLDASVGSGTVVARHDTLIGSSSAGSIGVSVPAFPAGAPATSKGTIESSIVRGYAASFSAVASAPFFSATTTVAVNHSFYDGALDPDHTGTNATATITPDATSGNKDPLFVNAAGGDFHLTAGSPAIDAGEATVASGESSTDLDGNPRVVTGHKGLQPTSDVGAYEFQPSAPTATARVEESSVVLGTPDTFGATGGDASPGDAVTFTWLFDDGGTAAGPTVTHIFTTPGPHTATVTVTDLDGFTADAQVALTVTVPRPKLTNLTIKPRALRNGRKATISYRDSEPGTVRLTVQRVKKHGKFARAGTLAHRSVAGVNRITYRPRKLRPGRYRIVAVPTDAAGAGPAVTARFTVRKLKKR